MQASSNENGTKNNYNNNYNSSKLSNISISPKRFSSQLRSPRYFELVPNVKYPAPYTPAPMLSPMRRGSGLFWKISQTSCARVIFTAYIVNDYFYLIIKINSRWIQKPVRKNGLCYSSHVFAVSLFHVFPIHKKIAKQYCEACYYFVLVQKSDCLLDNNRHINCGRDYQAKVKKWADRAITDEERDSIPDRDDAVFNCNIIDHLDDSAGMAYELLAHSKAVPRPGRNRELALHLLMENKGNIQEAVLDLMRLDTLDWSQYPIIYNSTYTDTSSWTPEEINFFQDAIYKSEKDFHQVAMDLGNKTVKQCVEFYYMWKKACPDDYRKLRNLRRKRQLLEMQQLVCQFYINYSDLNAASSSSSSPQADSKHSMMQFARPMQSSILCPWTMENDTVHRTPTKKGAQPAADGYFHCRLCDKYFEKVKSLNAHMKSHAMKARADAEAAQSQLNLLQRTVSSSNSDSLNNFSSKTKLTKACSSADFDSVSLTHHQNSHLRQHQHQQQQHHHHHHHHHQEQQQQQQQQHQEQVINREQLQTTIDKSYIPDGTTFSQDLFVQTAGHHQLAQTSLMPSPLGLATHQALNQSLTAASVLSQFPPVQALQFLNNIQHPAITH
ncbi:unnamed protein product [Thelazia callipaeda]|uniref:C2H2-type domain-containing protein n=1 Tax=Thelazia callipaeda TaxID=103827 RepID=A0A0N5CMG8_THECL|nr:unnamed protein product [Thelazia callipaeda]